MNSYESYIPNKKCRFEENDISKINKIRKLKTIANRKAMDDSTPLSLQDSIFKVSLVLVAKINIISSKGLTPYVNRINNAFSDGQDSVYVLIRKHSFSFSDLLIPKVSKETTGKNVWKRSVFTFDKIHGKNKALMYLFR